MKKIFLSLFSILVVSSLVAQRTVVATLLQETTVQTTTYWNEVHLDEAVFSTTEKSPFIAFSATIALADDHLPEGINISIRYSTLEQDFVIANLENDPHSNPENYVSKLLFLPTDAHNFHFTINSIEGLENKELLFHFFNPKNTPSQEETEANFRSLEECNCPQPEFQSRADWCPTGNCPEGPNPAFTEVSHLIIHHSAGVNTSSDWAAVVRSIWDYHVNSNGWDDIGYNWVVDPNGVLYEGRGDDIRGAHFCGQNTYTQGICVLGTYTNTAPTEAAMTSLKEYLAWKSAKNNIDPTDVSYHSPSAADIPNVAGHRDGCSTSCPGDILFAGIEQLRIDIRQYQARICGHPHSVTDLDLSLQNNTNVQLSWLDNSETEDGFWIQRATGVNGNFSTIETVPANTNSYLDTETEAQTLYKYQVVTLAGDSTSTCHLDAQITTQGTSNTGAILTTNDIELLPNPAENFIRLVLKNEYQGAVSVAVKDIMGRQTSIYFEYEKNNREVEFNLDLEDLATGVYFVQVKAGNAAGVFRILKK